MSLSSSLLLLGLASTVNCAAMLPSNFEDVRVTHGVLASIAFVILMPLGAILVRTARFKGAVWAHAGWMYVAYTTALVAMGLGIWLATTLKYFDKAHAIIGLVVVGTCLSQPMSGMLHHIQYKRTGRRSATSWVHLCIGRAVITLAIINGGLGLRLARPYQAGARKGEIVYGVVAGVMWLTWMVIVAMSFLKSRGVKENESNEQLSAPDSYPTSNKSVVTGSATVSTGKEMEL